MAGAACVVRPGVVRRLLRDLDACLYTGVVVREGRVPVVVGGTLTGTLFTLSGQRGFHAWWGRWQLGHFGGICSPRLCLSTHSSVRCFPAHTPQVDCP